MKRAAVEGELREPPRWATTLLRLILRSSDRESIPGDLLEEYREAILPRCGGLRADLWYVRQVASLAWHLVVRSRHRGAGAGWFGLMLGGALSLAVFAINIVFPLLPRQTGLLQRSMEAAPVVAAGWLSVFSLWMVAGYAAYRRTGAWGAAIKAGAIVALVSMALVMLTFAVIDNLFLDIVSRQPEKLWGFQHSQYHDMRAYINHGLLRGLCFVLPAFAAGGAALGAIGGMLARLRAAVLGPGGQGDVREERSER
jgi:hypothetical protein